MGDYLVRVGMEDPGKAVSEFVGDATAVVVHEEEEAAFNEL